jgi:hypothetical protein
MRSEPGDVISSNPRSVPGYVAWLATVALFAIALAVTIMVAAYYHGQASALRHQLSSVHTAYSPVAGQPVLSIRTSELPSAGTVTGQVTVLFAQSAEGTAKIIFSAHIDGGRPRTRYTLIGNDCASNGPDRSWGSGVSNGFGSADLSGPAWTVNRSHEYWMWLSPSPQNYSAGLHGSFAAGQGLSAFPAGQAPCAVG